MGLGFIGIGVGVGLVAAFGTLWLGGGGVLAMLAYVVGGTSGVAASVVLWLAHGDSRPLGATTALRVGNA